MKKIKLTQGKYAIVDDEDYSYLNRLSWYAKTYRGITHAVMRIRDGSFGNSKKKANIYMEQFLIKVPNNYKIGHINRDTLDNRKENLRATTQTKSLAYARKRKAKTYSKFKGVTFNKNKKDDKKWIANIVKNYRRYYLGYFKTEEEAALAYNERARELYGEFAYQNEV